MKSENPELQKTIKNICRKNTSHKIPYMERLVDEINKDVEMARQRPFMFNHNPRVLKCPEVCAGGKDSIHAMESSFPLNFIENLLRGNNK